MKPCRDWPRIVFLVRTPELAAGTIAVPLDDRAIAELHVASGWTPDLEDADQTARTLRRYRTVVLIAGTQTAAIKARTLIRASWRRTDSATEEAKAVTKALPAQAHDSARCGQPRAGGGKCTRSAGWGTSASSGPCADHGGVRASAVERQRMMDKIHTVAELSRKAHESGVPLTLREQLDRAVALREAMELRRKDLKRRGRGPDTCEDG